MGSKEFGRPNPDQLLRRIQAEEANNRRGRLKIFLGYAPRVGKSQRMFDEGRRRLKRGQDVVVGAVQTEGSHELEEMIREFEVIPPLLVGGGEAVDVQAIRKRRPQVCLIDELARSNPPGCRNAERWQDVVDLGADGMNVVGAINLQHVREQQDAVERITGRRAVHSAPESFIHSADELVVVDAPSDGPAYLNELRELALLLAAEVVEEQLQRYMDAHGIKQSWGTQERILVCITPRSSARVMLESGARAAHRFHGRLLAIYVCQGELSREDEETLTANLAHARRLGAEVHVLEGPDPTAAILAFAREHRVSQLFIGHTRQSSWKFWKPSLAGRLINAADEMDVRLFPRSQPG